MVSEIIELYTQPLFLIFSFFFFGLGLFMGRFIARRQYGRLFLFVCVFATPLTLPLMLLGTSNYLILLQIHIPFLLGLVPQIYSLLKSRG